MHVPHVSNGSIRVPGCISLTYSLVGSEPLYVLWHWHDKGVAFLSFLEGHPMHVVGSIPELYAGADYRVRCVSLHLDIAIIFDSASVGDLMCMAVGTQRG